MFGLSKAVWQLILSAVVLIVGFTMVRCYGSDRYERGRQDADIATTAKILAAQKHALDSAEKMYVPVLERLTAVNDSLREERTRLSRELVRTLDRAKRAERQRADIPDSIIAVTPPQVRDLIDSLVISNHELREKLLDLSIHDSTAVAQNDSLALSAAQWKSLYGKARETLATADSEIEQLKKKKDPPKCGFKCGATVGALTIVGIIASIFAISH